MTTWFTADWHLSHFKIIGYCERPFKSERQMNHIILKKYCELVQPEDTVFFVGDLSMRTREYKDWYHHIFNDLPGSKHLILGNHDTLPPFDYVDIGFTSVHTSFVVDEFILAHDPAVATIDINRKFICGHIHRLFKKCDNAVNVGVDVWDFKPVSIDQVKDLFNKEVYAQKI